jgi:hypothetical protein
MNFWLLYNFKLLNILFFGKNFVLIGLFGVPIIFLGFWIQPANSMPSGAILADKRHIFFISFQVDEDF